MAKHKEEKTNVMRVLDQKKIPYTAHTYDPESGIANVRTNQWFTEERFANRLSVAKQLDAKFAAAYTLKNVRAYSDLYDDAVKMMKSEELKAFDLEQEP